MLKFCEDVKISNFVFSPLDENLNILKESPYACAPHPLWWCRLSLRQILNSFLCVSQETFPKLYLVSVAFINSDKVKINQHCEKRVSIRSFSGKYSVQMQQNTDQKKLQIRARLATI